jgi:hypothetical protein
LGGLLQRVRVGFEGYQRVGFSRFLLTIVHKLASLRALIVCEESTMATETLYRVVPHPKLKRDYTLKKVRTLRELTNGWGTIPVGSIATITLQSPKGSTLKVEPCECCNLKAIISAIAPDDIEFIEPV